MAIKGSSSKKTTSTGKTTRRVERAYDTSIMTGRQQLKSQKIEAKKEETRFKQGAKAATAIAASNAAARTTQQATQEVEATKREGMRQATYAAALSKWNGIVNNTPDAAEGTGDPTDGSRGDNNYTGTQFGFLS